jgi:hypothetical protein
MAHLNSSENHGGDLTLKAAYLLLVSGFHNDLKPKTGNLSMGSPNAYLLYPMKQMQKGSDSHRSLRQ